MKPTLTQLTHLSTGDYFATWLRSGTTVESLHGSDGRCLASSLGAKLPRLTKAEMAAAHAERHPAYDLAAQGTAARPELARRMQAAADLVAGGLVTLYEDGAGIVASRSHACAHQVDDHHCDCQDFQFRGSWCAHRIARRMALALGQPELVRPFVAPAAFPQPRLSISAPSPAG